MIQIAEKQALDRCGRRCYSPHLSQNPCFFIPLTRRLISRTREAVYQRIARDTSRGAERKQTSSATSVAQDAQPASKEETGGKGRKVALREPPEDPFFGPKAQFT